MSGAKVLPFRPWIDDAIWVRRWTRAVADSFGALPVTPRRPPNSGIVSDGWSVVIEVADGRSYHFAGASNPHIFCSVDDQRMLRVVAALDLRIKSDCVPR